MALPPAPEKLRDDLGRVLQVGVHDHDRVAVRVVHARGDRQLVAEVAREREQLDPRVPLGAGGRPRRRAVPAAVVDEEQLEILGLLLEHAAQAIAEDGEALLLVQERHDDDDLAGRAHERPYVATRHRR